MGKDSILYLDSVSSLSSPPLKQGFVANVKILMCPFGGGSIQLIFFSKRLDSVFCFFSARRLRHLPNYLGRPGIFSPRSRSDIEISM